MLDKTNSFNENNTLLDKDNAYGTMIIEDNTEILEIEKKDLVMVSDEDSINLLRANCECKNRLLKNFLDSISNFNLNEITNHQTNLCKKYGLEIKEIDELFKKNIQNNKIVITSAINEKAVLISKFNKQFPNQIDLTENNLSKLQATNRLVAKPMNGLSAQQMGARSLLNKYVAVKKDSEPDVAKDLSKLSIGEKKNLNSIDNPKNFLNKFKNMEDKVKNSECFHASDQKPNEIAEETEKKGFLNFNERKVLKKLSSKEEMILDQKRLSLLNYEKNMK